MLIRSLRLAFRRLNRRRTDTVIKIVSLSVGLAVCLLIGTWVQDEMSFDDFHPGADQTYRLALYYELPGRSSTYTLTPSALASRLQSDMAGIEQTTQVLRRSRMVRRGSEAHMEEDFYSVTPSFLSMFDFPLLHGSREAALSAPGSVVLTAATAQKYFPNEDPMGASLRVDGNTYTVTGVAAPLPHNTHFRFDFLARLPELTNPGWRRNTVVTYVRTRDNTDPEALQADLTTLIRDRKPAAQKEGFDYALYLQPITGIHLGTGLPDGVSLSARHLPQTFGGLGDITTVQVFGRWRCSFC